MIAPFIYGSTASLHCAALPYLYSWESGMGRHWCVCRGGACPARPRSGKRTAKSIGCTVVSAVPPRNDTSGKREVHQRPHAVELPSTRRSLSAATFSLAQRPCATSAATPHTLVHAILTMPCTSRRFTAGTGCPLPYSTPRPAGFFPLYHIPREKSTLSEKSGLSP